MKNFNFVLLALVLMAFSNPAYTQKLVYESLRLRPGALPTRGSDGELRVDSGDNNNLKKYNSGTSSWDLIAGGGGGSGGFNMLQGSNFDFETGAPPTDWTASGGTFIAETGAPGFDDQSGSWDSSALSQTLDSALVAIPAGLQNNSCMTLINYKAETADDEYKLGIHDGTDVLAELSLKKTSGWNEAFFIHPCPATGSLRIRLTSNVADAGIILIDNVHLGENLKRIQQAENATFVGSVKITGCSVSRTNTGWADMKKTSGTCAYAVEGNAIAPTAGTEFGLQFATLKPGRYLFHARGIHGVQTSVTNNNVGLRFHDDTTGFGEGIFGSADANGERMQVPGFDGAITYNETQTNITIEVQAFTHIVGSAIDMRADTTGLEGGTALDGYKIDVYRFPLDEFEAVTVSSEAFLIDANLVGANPSLTAGAVSTYTAINSSTFTMSLNNNSNVAEVPCTSNPSTGLTCSVGNEMIGVAFDIENTGRYEACVDFSFDTSGSSGTSTTFQFNETNNADDTILQSGGSRLVSGANTAAANNSIVPYRLCGIFKFDTIGKKTLKLMYEKTATTSAAIIADGGVSVGNRDIHITVKPLSRNEIIPVVLSLGSGGSGEAGINYVLNPDAETDTSFWDIYLDAAGVDPVDGVGGTSTLVLSRETTASLLLREFGSFKASKGVGDRQGNGFNYGDLSGNKFAIHEFDKNKELKVSFEYKTSTDYASGDMKMFMYDILNAQLIPIENDTNGEIEKSALVGTTFLGTFQATDSGEYRLIGHVATTNALAYDVTFDTVKIGPEQLAPRSIITAWKEFTPVFNNGPTFNVGDTFKWRRNGSNVEIVGRMDATGTGAASPFELQMPSELSSLTIRQSYDAGFISSYAIAGDVGFSTAGVFSTTGNVFRLFDNDTGSAVTGSVITNGDLISFKISVEVNEWDKTPVISTEEAELQTVIVKYGVSSSTGNPTFTDNVAERIDYDTEIINTHPGSVVTGASWAFTSPRKAKYRVRANARWTTNSGLITTIINLYSNGVFSDELDFCGVELSCGDSAVVSLDKGQTIWIEAQVDTTGAAYSITQDVRLNYITIESIPDYKAWTALGVNKIDSEVAGLKLTSALIQGSGTAQVIKQDGNWISSITDLGGVGAWTVNIAADVFSVAPTCVCQYVSGFGQCQMNSGATTSAAHPRLTDSGGVSVDNFFNIWCFGPR